MEYSTRMVTTADGSRITLAGLLVDDYTRCEHYHTDLDVIALKFKCCEKYFPCFQCHLHNLKHQTLRYNADDLRTERVVLCGVCKSRLTFGEYTLADYRCVSCGSAFNPGCLLHYDLYFDLSSAEVISSACYNNSDPQQCLLQPE